PWQGVLMAQRLRQRGVRVEEYSFTGEGRRKLFGALLDLIRTNRLRSRPHDELRRELLSLEVQETASGWPRDHRVGRHDDHVVAVALAVETLRRTPQPSYAMPVIVKASDVPPELDAGPGVDDGCVVTDWSAERMPDWSGGA